MLNETTLGQRLRELRKERKLTQRQLAATIGLDYSYVSKIENDRLEHTPSIRTLQDLARALSTDELELMSLANKVPDAFSSVAENEHAMRFFRVASKRLTTPDEWKLMLEYLERDKPST